MSNFMEKYSDTPVEVAEPTSESPAKSTQRAWFKKKELRAIKALTRALRKRNKLLEQELELRKSKAETVEANADDGKRNKDGNEKGFFANLGKEIGKNLPKVIVGAVTGILGFIAKLVFARKAPQAA